MGKGRSYEGPRRKIGRGDSTNDTRSDFHMTRHGTVHGTRVSHPRPVYPVYCEKER